MRKIFLILLFSYSFYLYPIDIDLTKTNYFKVYFEKINTTEYYIGSCINKSIYFLNLTFDIKYGNAGLLSIIENENTAYRNIDTFYLKKLSLNLDFNINYFRYFYSGSQLIFDNYTVNTNSLNIISTLIYMAFINNFIESIISLSYNFYYIKFKAYNNIVFNFNSYKIILPIYLYLDSDITLTAGISYLDISSDYLISIKYFYNFINLENSKLRFDIEKNIDLSFIKLSLDLFLRFENMIYIETGFYF